LVKISSPADLQIRRTNDTKIWFSKNVVPLCEINENTQSVWPQEFSKNLRSEKFLSPSSHSWVKQLLSETIVGNSIFPENQNLRKADSITAFFKKQHGENPPVKYSSVLPPQNSLFKELSLPRF